MFFSIKLKKLLPLKCSWSIMGSEPVKLSYLLLLPINCCPCSLDMLFTNCLTPQTGHLRSLYAYGWEKAPYILIMDTKGFSYTKWCHLGGGNYTKNGLLCGILILKPCFWWLFYVKKLGHNVASYLLKGERVQIDPLSSWCSTYGSKNSGNLVHCLVYYQQQSGWAFHM